MDWHVRIGDFSYPHLLALAEASIDRRILLALACCQHNSSAIGSEIHAVILGEKRHNGFKGKRFLKAQNGTLYVFEKNVC